MVVLPARINAEQACRSGDGTQVPDPKMVMVVGGRSFICHIPEILASTDSMSASKAWALFSSLKMERPVTALK
jgi:hypothetical protein